MYSGVEMCVLMEGQPSIGVLGGDGYAASGRGSFGGSKSSFGVSSSL